MLKSIIDAIKGRKNQLNHTTIETAKLPPAKKSKVKKSATTPETKGRKPRTKTKRG